MSKYSLRKSYESHGMTGSPEYMAWRNMKNRCSCETSNQYKDYGGRGIKVCNRWLRFENFLKDMGEKPSTNHQLDRINNDGNYEPDNCRWTISVTNSRNQRSSRYWFIDGIKYESCYHAAEELGISDTAVHNWCNGYISRGKQYPPKENCYSELKYKEESNERS